MNPRSLTNTPQTLITSNAPKISTFSIAHKTLKCTNAPKIVKSDKAPKIPKTPEMTFPNYLRCDLIKSYLFLSILKLTCKHA